MVEKGVMKLMTGGVLCVVYVFVYSVLLSQCRMCLLLFHKVFSELE